MQDAQIYNAADKKQVKAAAKKELRGRDRDIEDLRFVLKTPQGMRVIWRMMVKCSAFKSVLHASGSMVYYNAGQQDIGHWLIDEVSAVDPHKLIEMMIQAKEDENG